MLICSTGRKVLHIALREEGIKLAFPAAACKRAPVMLATAALPGAPLAGLCKQTRRGVALFSPEGAKFVATGPAGVARALPGGASTAAQAFSAQPRAALDGWRADQRSGEGLRAANRQIRPGFGVADANIKVLEQRCAHERRSGCRQRQGIIPGRPHAAGRKPLLLREA